MKQLELGEFSFTGDRPWRDESVLRELYNEKKLTGEECAKRLNCNPKTIYKWLREYGFEIDRHRNKSGSQYPELRSETWLQEMYVEKGLTVEQCAEQLGCNHKTISEWLERYGIETDGYKHLTGSEYPELNDGEWLREMYIEKEIPTKQIADEVGCSSGTVRTWVRNHGIPTHDGYHKTTPRALKDRDELERLYIDKGLSMSEVASEFQCGHSTVRRWLRRHNIPVRSYSEARKGERNPNWRGGADGPPRYEAGWTEQTRETVRERDNRTCVDCGMSEETHFGKWDEHLHVHHICNARQSSNPAVYNAVRNLVALCCQCHIKRERCWDKENWISQPS